jgi:hypothetical protein
MSALFLFLPESPVAGLAAVGLNLLVAFALITVSLTLCAAISLLIGLPALVTRPQRAIRARTDLSILE